MKYRRKRHPNTKPAVAQVVSALDEAFSDGYEAGWLAAVEEFDLESQCKDADDHSEHAWKERGRWSWCPGKTTRVIF